MVNYKKFLIILCSIILVLLSSCTVVHNETLDQIVYNYSNHEGNVQEDGYYTKYVCTSTDRVEYYFEEGKYTEDQRADFINRIETLCTFLENEYEILFEEPLCIYVSEKAMQQGTDRKVFLNNLNIETIETVVTFLQAISDYSANYGLCYGISCYINEKLYGALLIPNISIEKISQYYTKNANMNLMDLTIPVFQTVYFTEEQNNYAYSSTYYFVKDLIERKGLKHAINLLKGSANLDLSFDIAYSEEKNIWLKSIGATNKCETPTIPIRYELKLGKSTKTYPYVIYTPSTISYFVPYEEFKADKIIMDYAYIKHYITIYELDVLELKKYLEPYFDTNKEPIPCYFQATNKGSSYYKYTQLEYANPLWSGVHEYVHYITYKDTIPVWLIEGIARYCQLHLEQEGVYRMVKESMSAIDLSSDKEFMDLYKKFYDTINEIDLGLFCEIDAYLNYKYKTSKNTFAWSSFIGKSETGSELSYAEAASLVNYLIETYGEENFFKFYEDHTKLKEIYGKTYEELKEEWLTQLISKME